MPEHEITVVLKATGVDREHARARLATMLEHSKLSWPLTGWHFAPHERPLPHLLAEHTRTDR